MNFTNKYVLYLTIFSFGANFCCGQQSFENNEGLHKPWAPVGDKIKTEWASDVSPDNVWKQYPRPQLVRETWKNLNGLWNYAITAKGQKAPPAYDGNILVPFCVESSLSGVGRPLLPENELWYQRTFDISDWKNKDIILHFGAVDFKSTLYINEKKVGTHEGGNDSFSYNITSFIDKNKTLQDLKLSVWDPTDTDIQPRGKQILKAKGFWYTAVSGIWQTVWLEPVDKTHVEQLFVVADVDKNQAYIKTSLANPKGNEDYKIVIKLKDSIVLQKTVKAQQEIPLTLESPELWSPDFPNLYDIHLIVSRNGKTVDEFDSYFAMRKIELGTDKLGFTKLFLNNEEIFHWGVLDQGWWPDGLLTPPSEEAMVYDMKVVKDLGFNTIRKHIKVEPAIYYHNADKMGILVWQDMPSGFLDINHPEQHVKHDSKVDWNRPKQSANQFKSEWKSIIDNLRFFPSIVVWVPFNEGWGQFQSQEITNWTMQYDLSRLTNGISGWADRKVGHFYDAHQYPGPGMEPPSQNKGRAVVLGEFGGLGFPVEGHIWDASRKNWGYRTYTNKNEFLNQYTQAVSNLYPEKARGLAAAIYTQTTDVEAEVNGIMTYDRKIIKLPIDFANVLHDELYRKIEKRVHYLVEDAETKSNKKLRNDFDPYTVKIQTSIPKENYKLVEYPTSLKNGQSIKSKYEFTLNSIPQNLALKFYGDGDATFYLNGKKIMSKYLRTKRHYDDINLSHFIKYLFPGKNTITIELLHSKSDTEFDYGLYTF